MKITDEMVEATIQSLRPYPWAFEENRAHYKKEIEAALTAALATQPDHGAELARLTAEVARLRGALEKIKRGPDFMNEAYEGEVLDWMQEVASAALEAADAASPFAPEEGA